MQIVIAWAEKTKLVPTGRTITKDHNQFPEFTTTWEGRACMWLNRGTTLDVEKAQAWAATEGRTVYTFENDKNPLESARHLAVEAMS